MTKAQVPPTQEQTNASAAPVPMGGVIQGMDKPTPIDPDYAEFEIGHHQVPWFLWLFFGLIVSWASVSWIKFFGY